MIVKSAEFIKSAAEKSQFPETDFPEIAFCGRSNVGKSSLINAILGRKKLVKVSNTPGRTQLVNFFRVNDCCHFVDLPGYGFAKAPKHVRLQWEELIVSFLASRKQLAAVVHILDVRRDISEEDSAVFDIFHDAALPVILAISKADKLSKQKRMNRKNAIAKQLGLMAGDCHLTSVTERLGLDALWAAMDCFLEGCRE